MDIGHTVDPTSEQLDSVDLLQGPRTFEIERVSKGPSDQPVQIHLRDFPRPWRPGKSMRRILIACWGADASAYVGRFVRLYCDPSVVFGGQAVGGTRIEALSHIDGPKKVPLLISRGKSAIWNVQPLADAPTAPATYQRITDALAHYRTTYNVTAAQLEQHIGAPSDDWSPADIDALSKLAGELKNGTKTVGDVFGAADGTLPGTGE